MEPLDLLPVSWPDPIWNFPAWKSLPDRACGRNDWPPITIVIFRNYQWRAEERNTTLWFDDNFVGTELNLDVNYAKVAEGCGLKGVQARSMDELTEALRTAVREQMEDGVNTFIEVVLNQELGEPFRRDAKGAGGGCRHRRRGHARAGGRLTPARSQAERG